MPRRPPREPLRQRILDLFHRTPGPWAVRDIAHEFGVDGPSEETVRVTVRWLVESGELAACGRETRPEMYRVKGG